MDPAIAVAIVYGVDRDADPERYNALKQELDADSSPYEIAGMFSAQSVIEPHETRQHLVRALDIHCRNRTDGLSKRLLSGWPCR
jgi:acetyl-CoA carboxylase carboxyltransferase component